MISHKRIMSRLVLFVYSEKFHVIKLQVEAFLSRLVRQTFLSLKNFRASFNQADLRWVCFLHFERANKWRKTNEKKTKEAKD